jgi:hypothetical protein
MTDNNCFEEYVVFGIRKPDPGKVPRRCTVCGANPSLFEYQRHTGNHPVRNESGTCCTACAFNMLLRIANEEAREWAALAGA